MKLEELRKKRLKWVEANRENDFEDGIKRLLTDLYPDNAHFIYELLQNAEDAHATEVCFILKEDGVEFEHNGDRLFSIEDVEAITSIGVSHKRDDPTNIGKFGVGFKAVFAYTSTPEIASGEYHFRIRDLVVPDTDGLAPCALGEQETRFSFPFDNLAKEPQKAVAEIEKNLRKLDEGALLFLSNIKKIKYLLPDSTLGLLERREADENRIEIVVRHPEDSEPASVVFLRFEKMVDVNDEDGKPKSCRVAVAFGMEKTQGQEWKIRLLDRGQVCIYFPAEKETSNLRFHLHAPFASTVARDSVRECEANDDLRDQLAELIAESMTAIRDQGLLTVRFLATLPNNGDNLSPFYKPIMDRLIETFRNENLTPMKQGGHAAAKGIFRGLARLSDLISDNDLATILGEDYSPPLWVANPPQRNQREDNFLSMLNISEMSSERFAKLITGDFLTTRTDDWMIQFYIFLDGAPDLWKRPDSILRQKKILRLEDNSHTHPFQPDGSINAYLPSSSKTELLTVKRDIVNDKGAKQFLKNLGLLEPDLFTEVIEILSKYVAEPNIGLCENIEDLRKIGKLLEDTSQADMNDLGKLRIVLAKLGLEKYLENFEKFDSHLVLRIVVSSSIKIIRAIDSSNRENYKTPKEVYFDSDELHMYFQNNANAWFVAKRYPEDLERLFAKLQIERVPRIEQKNKNSAGYVPIHDSHGRHERGLDGFDPDMRVDGLECAVSDPTSEKSAFIWNKIAIPNSVYIRGIVEKSTRQTYAGRKKEKQLSEFGKLLTDTAWLPDLNGKMHKPRKLTLDDLPKSFARDEKLADQLGMKKDDVAKLAEKAGISKDVLNLAERIENAPPKLKKIKSLLQGENKQTQQPESIPNDSVVDGSPHNSGTGDGDSTQGGGTPGGSGGGHGENGGGGGGSGRGSHTNGTSTDVNDRTNGGDNSSGTKPFISYIGVSPDEEDRDLDGLEHSARMDLEAKAIDFILSRESDWQRTPRNNPGFDLYKTDRHDNQIAWCEVKAMSGTFDNRPTTMTRRQFEEAQERGGAYWLYVVENAGTDSPRIVRIQDPAGKVRTFTFDKGWLNVARIDEEC